MTACRFGFMQALRAWEDNAAARAGLESCLEAMIEHEIEQRDAEGARALHADLPAPNEALARRIEALEADLREASAREARLRAMERDLDVSISARTQLALVGIVITFGLIVSVRMFQTGWRTPTHREAIAIPAAGLCLVLTGAAVLRRRLQTAISRRTTGVLMLLPASVLVHRILAARQGTPVVSIVLLPTCLVGVDHGLVNR